MKFEGSTLNFTYDASGTPLTMSIDGTVYYYVTNLQGDVVGLLDTTGAQVVTYTYDAWGVGLTVTGTKANSIGMLNPLRYRGYVYDVGTGLYYLQSRYYDPQVGRFINADGLASTGQGLLGNNMFVYCLNNPGNCLDSSGARCVAVQHHLYDGKTTDVGAAPDYFEIGKSNGDRSKNPNCYAYALGYYDRAYDPGDFSGGRKGDTLEAFAEAIHNDMIAMNRGCRPLDFPWSPIEDDEYRIALNVTKVKINYYGYEIEGTDYHLMVQTSSGQWAEKVGPNGPTILHSYGDPSTISWDKTAYDGLDYGDKILYFAITP